MSKEKKFGLGYAALAFAAGLAFFFMRRKIARIEVPYQDDVNNLFVGSTKI